MDSGSSIDVIPESAVKDFAQLVVKSLQPISVETANGVKVCNREIPWPMIAGHDATDALACLCCVLMG